ncbi:MAG: peptide MFS transporter [Blastocatellia bacterium]|nr:peptide MFS transporter [Blastocatellia bacterium]
MATQLPNQEPVMDTGGIGGHPRGLTTLFFTEMWERFSYYGMRALLILYMTTEVAAGGMGMDTKRAATIYAAYVGSVYLMSIPGGWIADNVLGTRMAVFVGGVIIALGHFSMAMPTTATFFAGLILIVLGTGLLKPNVSAIVGSLYGPTDPRRDAGFSIFYMGINLGAGLAPLICSYLGEKVSWHLGFGTAGIFMTLGLVQYQAHRERLAHVGHAPAFPREAIRKNAVLGALFMAAITATVVVLYFGPALIQDWRPYIMVGGVALMIVWLFTSYLRPEEKKPVAAIVVLFVFAVVFWAVFEQAGSSFNLFARDFTDRTLPGSLANLIRSAEFPAGWYQSVNSIFLITLAPVFSLIWLKLGRHQPSSPVKFALGLLFVGAGALVLALASSFIGGSGKVGPYWLVGVYLCHTIGELCLSPVGLSTTTKLAPERLSGLMMGVWFLSISFGNFFAGEVAGNFSREALFGLFSKVAAGPVIAGVALIALTPMLRKLMGKVR